MKKKIKQLSSRIEKKPWIALLFVLLLCFLFRSYHVVQLFPFTMDEEYQAFLATDMLKSGHVPLIGVNVANTGLYLGPLFTWASALLYWFGSGSPLMTAWAAVAISVLTCWLLIKNISLITSDYWLGLIGGLLYSVNPFLNMYDHKFWNPSLVMLLTVWWLYCLIKSRLRDTWWWGVALTFGLAFHVHYSLFVLVIPTLYEIIVRYVDHNPHKSVGGKIKQQIFIKKIIKRFLVTLVAFLSPLILFEFRHGFVQTKALINYFVESGGVSEHIWYRFWIWHASLNRLLWLGFNKDFAYELSLASQSRSTLVLPLSLVFILLIWHLIRYKKYRWYAQMVLVTMGSFLAAILAYKLSLSEYYFLPLFPLLVMLIMINAAALIERWGIKAEYYLGGILALLLMLWSAQSLTLKNSLGLAKKVALMKRIAIEVGEKPYRLESIGMYKYEGYRYLAQWQGITPSHSYMDSNFDWITSYEKGKEVDKTIVIMSKLDAQSIPELYEQSITRVIALPDFILGID